LQAAQEFDSRRALIREPQINVRTTNMVILSFIVDWFVDGLPGEPGRRHAWVMGHPPREL
jgi:hypothetical protein